MSGLQWSPRGPHSGRNHGTSPAHPTGNKRNRDQRRGGQRRRAQVAESNPRLVALDVLVAVERDDAYANLLLRPRLDAAGVTGVDAALATELTYGTLRLIGYYDAVIALAAHRAVTEIDTLAKNALRLGAHQLLGMRTKTHAAVNETVTVASARGSRGAVGFINAILRRIAERTPEQWHTEVLAAHPDPVDRMAVEHSHPEWIVRAFRDALDIEGRTTELAALLAADNDNPAVQLVALPGLAERDNLLAAHPETLTAEVASPTALRLSHGDPLDFPPVREGTVRVQDAGSQLVALALAHITPIAAGERILDLCAGPGGKTALLAAEALCHGADFQANEITPARAKLVRDALRPLYPETELPPVTERDGREYAQQPDSFDRVLVDVPCFGLGALRRRPEARWRKRPEDIAELTQLQEELLAAAITATKPGGVIAYVTCSPHLAETAAVVRRVLRTHPATVLDAVETCLALAPELDLVPRQMGEGTAVQLWPHRHGTDAMFLALLRKPGA
ncbi:transcription antitermination factor NusB [uncultured Gulosibacter sp.]|uniref:RsmB/NOP family class I SAM-dependent RNA methyltransferase n=1 Tax=uncultured Gulosibacter sp. TaxID=1339167 RepID=UPI0028893BE6|nr:transcription antitermination factor NusB [uncultured Gulosibacter sp.]